VTRTSDHHPPRWTEHDDSSRPTSTNPKQADYADIARCEPNHSNVSQTFGCAWQTHPGRLLRDRVPRVGEVELGDRILRGETKNQTSKAVFGIPTEWYANWVSRGEAGLPVMTAGLADERTHARWSRVWIRLDDGNRSMLDWQAGKWNPRPEPQYLKWGSRIWTGFVSAMTTKHRKSEFRDREASSKRQDKHSADGASLSDLTADLGGHNDYHYVENPRAVTQVTLVHVQPQACRAANAWLMTWSPWCVFFFARECVAWSHDMVNGRDGLGRTIRARVAVFAGWKGAIEKACSDTARSGFAICPVSGDRHLCDTRCGRQAMQCALMKRCSTLDDGNDRSSASRAQKSTLASEYKCRV